MLSSLSHCRVEGGGRKEGVRQRGGRGADQCRNDHRLRVACSVQYLWRTAGPSLSKSAGVAVWTKCMSAGDTLSLREKPLGDRVISLARWGLQVLLCSDQENEEPA